MVIARIFMGLGNQMFQYAAGRSLALHKNTSLKVDTVAFDGYTRRKYELSKFFTIDAEEATDEEKRPFRFNHPVKRTWNKVFPKRKLRMIQLTYEEQMPVRSLLRFYDFIFPPHKQKIFTERQYHYDRRFFKANDDIYLNGFWMSWKYFKKYDEQIRKDFTVRPELVQHLDQLTLEIKNTNSVGVHIRRGDLTSVEYKDLKGLVPISYYTSALEEIKAKRGDINVFVFSDDIAWVKANLKTDCKLNFISDDITKSAIEDFYLMTICKDNIIGNSTFSWWAAYLNCNTDKLVIAPKKWYVTSKYNSKDVYPPEWQLIDYPI